MHLLLGKGTAVIFLNELHTPFFDQFFKYYTYLGSGFVLLALALLSSFISYRVSLLTILIAVFQGVTVFLFKVLLFPGIPRPPTYFMDDPLELHFVEGVSILYYRSFPSGHTLTAFSVALLLASSSKSYVLSAGLLLYALLVGVSRVYLAHHFLIDTVAGAVLGISVTLLALFISKKSGFFKRHSLDHGLQMRSRS